MAAIRDRGSKPFQTMQQWIEMTVARNPQLKDYAAAKTGLPKRGAEPVIVGTSNFAMPAVGEEEGHDVERVAEGMLGELGAAPVVARAAGIGAGPQLDDRHAEIEEAAGCTTSSSQGSMRGMIGQASVTVRGQADAAARRRPRP